MSKHTPGPWVFYDDSNDGKTKRIEIAARGKTVARIYHSVPKEDLPNARLIAAAPDLLEALEYMVNTCPAIDPSGGDAHTRARYAIAKATGEQQ
jgi:hypothetical protein